MLTKDEEAYLETIPADKKVEIYSFNPKVTETANEIVGSIKQIYPSLDVKHWVPQH